MALEQRNGNGIALSNATRIIGMQVVSAVICMKQLRRMAWVTQDRIEIDHTIEFTTAANPVVNLLTHGFPLGSIKSGNQPFEGRVLKWRVCRPNDTNPVSMATRDELTIAGDDVLITDLFIWRSERECREKDVIDAQTHDDVPDARLS